MTTIEKYFPVLANISIHIPRVGDDANWILDKLGSDKFQSTSPVWGMTKDYERFKEFLRISIHIPRVGDDLQKCQL